MSQGNAMATATYGNVDGSAGTSHDYSGVGGAASFQTPSHRTGAGTGTEFATWMGESGSREGSSKFRSLALLSDPPPLPSDRRVIRIGQTRVSIDSIIHRYCQGDRPEHIRDQFPTVSLPEVYATIAYYLFHQAEVDAYLIEQERRADEIQAQIESQQDPRGIRERLLARKRAE